ncbi:hypothetical protein J6590_102613 [Homalodisca vitripennis]|nr:hypothetical protein J6590_102613 [Homalodisca vitripennis]
MRVEAAYTKSTSLEKIPPGLKRNIPKKIVCELHSTMLSSRRPTTVDANRLSRDNRIKQRRAWLLLGWVIAERSYPCKQPACPAIGAGLEVTFKPLVPRLSVREGFLSLTSPGCLYESLTAGHLKNNRYTFCIETQPGYPTRGMVYSYLVIEGEKYGNMV